MVVALSEGSHALPAARCPVKAARSTGITFTQDFCVFHKLTIISLAQTEKLMPRSPTFLTTLSPLNWLSRYLSHVMLQPFAKKLPYTVNCVFLSLGQKRSVIGHFSTPTTILLCYLSQSSIQKKNQSNFYL